MFKFVIGALVAANVAAVTNEWTVDTINTDKKMYKNTIDSTSKPDQAAGDFKMRQGGNHFMDGSTLMVNLWVELTFPKASIISGKDSDNDNDIFWGINFRPTYPKAEKNWDGIRFSAIDFDANAGNEVIKVEDVWSNSGMLPVLNTSGTGSSQVV